MSGRRRRNREGSCACVEGLMEKGFARDEGFTEDGFVERRGVGERGAIADPRGRVRGATREAAVRRGEGGR